MEPLLRDELPLGEGLKQGEAAPIIFWFSSDPYNIQFLNLF